MSLKDVLSGMKSKQLKKKLLKELEETAPSMSDEEQEQGNIRAEATLIKEVGWKKPPSFIASWCTYYTPRSLDHSL